MRRALVLATALTLGRSPAQANGFSLLVGNRGAQTTDVPSPTLSLKALYATKAGTEFALGVFDASLGKRWSLKSGLHFSAGGFVGFDVFSQAAGPGIYGAVAYDLVCLGACLTFDYTQQLGFNARRRYSDPRGPVFSTFAFRAGISLWN
jgi:hypothetical protein